MSFQENVAVVFDGAERYLRNYGLGLLFAANVFGAGSIYILSSTGANFGFLLLWVVPFTLVVDLLMHEMSGRLATIDRPLMSFIRDGIGATAAKPFAVGVSLIMQLWSVANYAVAGAALVWLTPLSNVYLGIVISASAGILLVQLRYYDRIEAVITAMVFAVFGSYVLLMFGLELPIDRVVAGFVPTVRTDFGYLTMLIAMLGTTVYYPNFFIQSSIKPTKEWDSMTRYRKDNFFGISTTILLSLAVLVVSAATLSEGELSLVAPGEPLTALLGPWALTVFVFAVLLASFTSATGTLFGAGFMVPQSFGHRTEFGDRRFRHTVVSLIALSTVLAVLVLQFTGFNPVRLAITMPAVNGIVGLPITALALWKAVDVHFDLRLRERFAFGGVVVLMLLSSLLTAQSLWTTIVGYL